MCVESWPIGYGRLFGRISCHVCGDDSCRLMDQGIGPKWATDFSMKGRGVVLICVEACGLGIRSLEFGVLGL